MSTRRGASPPFRTSPRDSGAAAEPPLERGIDHGWFPYVLIAPALVVLVVVALVPFLYTVWLSLHEMQFARVGAWAGLANTYFWIDQTKGIGGVYMTQVLPFADAKALPLFYAFETAVYKSMS